MRTGPLPLWMLFFFRKHWKLLNLDFLRWPGHDAIAASLAIMKTLYPGTMERWRRGCTWMHCESIVMLFLDYIDLCPTELASPCLDSRLANVSRPAS